MSFRIHAETNDTELVPTTTADTAAELDCGRWQTPRPACVVRSLRLGSGVCVLRAAEPAQRRSREGGACCHRPQSVTSQIPPRTSTRRRVSAMIRLKFLCHPTPDWQNPGRSSKGAMGYGHKKRARKVPPVPDRLKQQTFRTLTQVPVFFLMAVRRSRSFLRRSAVSSK